MTGDGEQSGRLLYTAVTMSPLNRYQSTINQAMKGDRRALRRLLTSMQRAEQQGKPFDRNLRKFETQLEASIGRCRQRQQSVPSITWPDELPVVARRAEIADAIRDHQVIVVCGETGSGKSTQLPKIALELGRGIDGVIGHTQPRRIAARSIASRLAEELKCPLGQQVGYRIRFTDTSGPQTLIRLMTDGIMLAETQSDRFLEQYDTIIVDEAHERSLNIDFLIGYLKRLLPERPDLRIIVTSATIDAERFAEFFATADNPVPVIQVEGRTWPVEMRYRPLEGDSPDDRNAERDWLDGIADAVDELASESHGHILVFLPTERDIREAERRLGGKRFPGDSVAHPTQIVSLYGRLSMADQARVFQTYQYRRIVLATNVAESSVTVPGIRSVIDTGTARISRYSARSRMQRLPIEAVSQASARQRAGRCGRLGPGICIRLYSEEDFNSRDEFTQPEIQRTNLAAVILRTLHLKLGDLEDFPFLDPPRPTTIRDGYRTLEELGATEIIDGTVRLTQTGQRMARLPVEPRISRMILAAIDEHAVPEVLIIASALETQDPRDRPLEHQQAADEAHAQFVNSDSDFLTYVNLWDAWHDHKQKLSGSQLKKWCRRNFLSWMRMREWVDVHRQLRDLLRDSGEKELVRAARLHPQKDRKDDFAAIHRSLMTGLLSYLAWKTAEREYTGAGGHKLVIWPGSALAAKPPKWLVAGELVETSRRFARTIARIQPEWIEGLAGHLVKREVTEPHWDAKSGNIMAFEKVSLWGLPIVPRRRVPLSRTDPVRSRELLIQHGLVELGLLYETTEVEREAGTTELSVFAKQFPFLQHNADILSQLEDLQAKTRQHDVLPTDETLFEIYAQQIPADVCDRERLKAWYRRTAAKRPDLLRLSLDQFTSSRHRDRSEEQFPGHLVVGNLRLPLTYAMNPGQDSDGVTVSVPVEALPQLPESRLTWLVPGLLEDKVAALIRSLPKAVRHLFVPVPDTAREVVGQLTFGEGRLQERVAEVLSRIAGEPVSAERFEESALPDHLTFTIQVIRATGERIAESHSLTQLREQVATNSSSTNVDPVRPPAEEQWHRSGFKGWDFADIPVSIGIRRADIELSAFPAIVDDGDSVSLTLCSTAAEAQAVLRQGIRRLVLLAESSTIRRRVQQLAGLDRVRLLASSIRGIQLEQDMQLLMVERAYLSGKDVPRTQAAFEQCLANGRNLLGGVAREFVETLPKIFDDYHATRRALDIDPAPGWQPILRDMTTNLAELVHAEFLATTPWAWLIQYPRYFACLRQRVQRLTSGGLQTEQRLLAELAPLENRYRERHEQHRAHNISNAMLNHYRWMLEEFRVSLFAPKLGTAIRVSKERLDRHWESVG